MLFPTPVQLDIIQNLPKKITRTERFEKIIYGNKKGEVNLFENIFKGLVKKYGKYSVVLDKLKNHPRLKHNKKHKMSLLYAKEMISYLTIFTKEVDWTHWHIESCYYLVGDNIKVIQEHPEYLAKVKYRYYLNNSEHIHVVDQFDLYSCICFYLGSLYYVEFNKEYIDYLYNKTNITDNLLNVGFNLELSVKRMSKLENL